MVDLLLSEVLIRLRLALRHLEGAQLRLVAGGRSFYARPIKVVAVGDLPDEAHVVGAVRDSIEAECFVGLQELVAAGLRL